MSDLVNFNQGQLKWTLIRNLRNESIDYQKITSYSFNLNNNLR